MATPVQLEKIRTDLLALVSGNKKEAADLMRNYVGHDPSSADRFLRAAGAGILDASSSEDELHSALEKILTDKRNGTALAQKFGTEINPLIKGPLDDLLAKGGDPAKKMFSVLRTAADVGEEVAFWKTPGKSKLSQLLKEIDQESLGEQIDNFESIVKYEAGDAAAELGSTMEMELGFLKTGVSMGTTDAAKRQAGKDFQIKLRTYKEELLQLHKEVNNRHSGIFTKVKDNLEKGLNELKGLPKQLQNAAKDGGGISAVDIKKMFIDDSTAGENIKSLFEFKDAGKGVMEIFFAGKSVGKSASDGTFTVKEADNVAKNLGNNITYHLEHVNTAAQEKVEELTKGILKRAERLESLQGEVQTLTGAAPLGKRVGGAATDVAKSGDKAAESAAKSGEEAGSKAGRSLALGTGIGIVGGIVLRRALFSQPDEENSLVKDGIAGVVGGLVGRTVHSLLGNKTNIAAHKDFSQLAGETLGHIRG